MGGRRGTWAQVADHNIYEIRLVLFFPHKALTMLIRCWMVSYKGRV